MIYLFICINKLTQAKQLFGYKLEDTKYTIKKGILKRHMFGELLIEIGIF